MVLITDGSLLLYADGAKVGKSVRKLSCSIEVLRDFSYIS